MNQQTSTSSDTLLSISKIQEQLNMLNRKMDMILGKLSNNTSMPKTVLVPSPKLNYPPVSANKPVTINPPSREKMMYQVICADCQKNCSIPFKPSADRPVYCKECFALRRNGQTSKVIEPAKIPERVAAPTPVKEAKKKPVTKKKVVVKKTAVKKVVVKKKTVTKKKK